MKYLDWRGLGLAWMISFSGMLVLIYPTLRGMRASSSV